MVVDWQLQWTKQLFQVKFKLNKAIGILSKVWYGTNPDILEIRYYSLVCFTSATCMSVLGSKEFMIAKPNPNTSK